MPAATTLIKTSSDRVQEWLFPAFEVIPPPGFVMMIAFI
jgi:hypothetical protein